MNFDFCFKKIIEAEGEAYTNILQDKGGPTKFGITLSTLAVFRGKQVSPEDVKNLTIGEAKDIYFSLYFAKNNLSLIKDPHLSCLLFDQIVNRKHGAAITILQEILNKNFGFKLVKDGKLGPKTAEAANKSDFWKLTIKFVIEVQRHYLDICKKDPTQMKFLQGWIARSWKLLDLIA